MKVHLVDGTYELFRSFYGPPPKKAPNGREVGATVGLMRSLLALLNEPGVTHIGVAAILGRQIGRIVDVTEVPLEAWRAEAEGRGLGRYQVDSLVRMFQYYEEHGLTSNPNALRWLLGRAPTSFASFARREFA